MSQNPPKLAKEMYKLYWKIIETYSRHRSVNLSDVVISDIE